jgi:diphthamide biosynthesis protein 3
MSIYDEVEIEDMFFDEEQLVYTYPCPCGDKFRITLEELHEGEDIAKCPSCTLRIMVIYEETDLPKLPEDDEEGEEEEEETNVITEQMQSVSIKG